ncbi:hypothetical protein AV530_005669 [Patagioenas fasciata monilis]|uniref:Uncharacterized protein n=1 Tax=Patagioenas fasciata monilis TaxID=372326 RepID=A0A1V4JM64_PATFA|nr:hypothetical protein AV530_005669 [Patagioenas fasciata monilis]
MVSLKTSSASADFHQAQCSCLLTQETTLVPWTALAAAGFAPWDDKLLLQWGWGRQGEEAGGDADLRSGAIDAMELPTPGSPILLPTATASAPGFGRGGKALIGNLHFSEHSSTCTAPQFLSIFSSQM